MEHRQTLIFCVIVLLPLVMISTLEIYYIVQTARDRKSSGTPGSNDKDDASASVVSKGTTIFWAIVTLAAYAMTQSSYTCHEMFMDIGTGFHTWPYRSIPMICVADTIAEVDDLYVEWQRERKAEIQTSRSQAAEDNFETREGPAGAKDVMIWMIRLAVFVFGVMPQAIQVLKMSEGVKMWRIRALALAFLIPSTWSLLMSAPWIQHKRLRGKTTPRTQNTETSNKIQGNEASRQSSESSSKIHEVEEEKANIGGSNQTIEMVAVAFFLHTCSIAGTWSEVERKTVLCRQDANENLLNWIEIGCSSLCYAITVLELVRRPPGMEPSIRRTKVFQVLAPIWVLIHVGGLFSSHGGGGMPFSIPLIIALGIASAFARMLRASVCPDSGIRQRSLGDEDASSNEHTSTFTPVADRASKSATDAEADVGMQAANPGESQSVISEPPVVGSGSEKESITLGATPAVNDIGQPSESKISNMASILPRFVAGVFEIWLLEPMLLAKPFLPQGRFEILIAFTLLNLGTLAVWYCVFFGIENEWHPSWSQLLG